MFFTATYRTIASTDHCVYGNELAWIWTLGSKTHCDLRRAEMNLLGHWVQSPGAEGRGSRALNPGSDYVFWAGVKYQRTAPRQHDYHDVGFRCEHGQHRSQAVMRFVFEKRRGMLHPRQSIFTVLCIGALDKWWFSIGHVNNAICVKKVSRTVAFCFGLSLIFLDKYALTFVSSDHCVM